jgi:hypothetical protein
MISENIGYIINEGFDGVRETKILTESSYKFNGKAIGEGVLQTVEEKNRNGRWYSYDELVPQLSCPRTVELLNAGYMRAELGHPMSQGGAADLARQSTIDDKLTSARFLEFSMIGNDVHGKFVGTNNSYGRAFDLDLKEGCFPAWSLRALGTVQQTNRGAEVKNLRLITYDQVIYPSHPGAYTKQILSESAALINESTSVDATGEAKLFPIVNKDVISYIQQESANIKFIQEYFDFAYTNINVTKNGTKVILTEAETGNTIIVPMERHIHNEFMTYASDEIRNKFWED